MRFRVLALVLLATLASPSARAAPDEDAYPDADSARLAEIDEWDPDEQEAYFEWKWLDEKIEPWQQFKDRVNEEWGLDFFIAYSPQFQAGTQEHKRQTLAQ